ncbi:Ldh family oxidoreductase [Cellulomonas palmilytica]|uniref:Ldh family oxidoreductase n=1 Tax=Cellulomonas palmilytica TaxID=2608402 RepID=UPI001F26A477|nr:Ldh family oxidoreductase [Cellulomonas palmilytica]UJP40680.1 Ldh family oxidoreductase [Cellulomonas palmilytica]
MIPQQPQRRALVLSDGRLDAEQLRRELRGWSVVDIASFANGCPPSVVDRTVLTILEDAHERVLLLGDVRTAPLRSFYTWVGSHGDAPAVLVREGLDAGPWVVALPVRTYATVDDIRRELETSGAGPSPSGRPRRRTMAAPDVQEGLERLFTAEGLTAQDAATVAAALVHSEREGYPSHGVLRVPEYVTKLRSGLINPRGRPRTTAWGEGRYTIDGDRAMGAVVVRHLADDVLARDESVQWIAVRRSGHLGRLAHLVRPVAEAGRMAFAVANSAGGGQKVAPFGGSEPRLGTNPIAFATPMPGGPPLVVDVSTSSVSEGAVRNAALGGPGVPRGAVQDRYGRAVRIAPDVLSRATLQPLGATQGHGHKGFALALMVEVLAGVLPGSGFVQAGVPSSGTSALLVTIDLAALGRRREAVLEDLGRMAAYVASSPSLPGSSVRLPGERALCETDVHLPETVARHLAPYLAASTA